MDGSTLDQRMREAVDRIIAEQAAWIKSVAEAAQALEGPEQTAALERRLRSEGLDQLRAMQQALLQARLDQRREAERACPGCGARRRHKGERARTVVGVLGPVRLSGPQWHCGCGAGGQHAARSLYAGSLSPPLRELLCLLGIREGGFEQAERACEKLLGVRLSGQTIRRVTEAEGRRAAEAGPGRCDRPVCGTLVGSCDGTMVHTRADGWRELRAWRFDDGLGRRASGAALEPAETFVPRLRREALAQDAAEVQRFVFVSDAAAWIQQAVEEFLPEAERHVIDIYHATQHLYEAARAIHGEGTEKAERWAKHWCEMLRTHGGRAVWDRLRRARFDRPEQQEALQKLLGYLDRHADRMEYPRYRREGLPISSGPMESTCKQLGLRLKGPGMRWNRDNVDPMAALISLWNDNRWAQHWRPAA